MLITLYMDIRISTRTDDEYSTAAEAVHSLKEAMDLGAARSYELRRLAIEKTHTLR